MITDIEPIKAKAKNLGFSFIGFTEVQQSPHFQDYLKWLERDQFGHLEFLNKHYVIGSRREPGQLLKGAKSIVVLGVKYSPLLNKKQIEFPDKGVIAAYAQYEDYHHVVKTKSVELMESINNERSEKINYRIFIDSGPLMEKDFAYAAGLGWIGKNSLFIHPELGSFTFLCCIMVDKDLNERNQLSINLCENCHLCEQACPTQCIIGNHTIDASRCISYLTIEHKGIIPRNLRSLIGNHVFGCDICQDVCPYNTRVTENQSEIYFNFKKKSYHPLDILMEMSLTEETFKEKYLNTPILRVSHERHLRNIIIAAGNSRNHKFIKPLKELLTSDLEIIRIHAVWALWKIGLEECFLFLRSHLSFEKNDLVRDEIKFALR
jgi:epoxyqueuosine reductase